MSRSRDSRDPLAGEIRRADSSEHASARCSKSPERAIEWARGFGLLKGLWTESERGDDDISLAAIEGAEQIRERKDLRFAANFKLRAQGRGDFDIEAGQAVRLIAIVEWWEAVIDKQFERSA